jgi:hypothetical protein
MEIPAEPSVEPSVELTVEPTVEPTVQKPDAAPKKRGRPKKEPSGVPIIKNPVGRPKKEPPPPPEPSKTPIQIIAEALQHQKAQKREYTAALYSSFMPRTHVAGRII